MYSSNHHSTSSLSAFGKPKAQKVSSMYAMESDGGNSKHLQSYSVADSDFGVTQTSQALRSPVLSRRSLFPLYPSHSAASQDRHSLLAPSSSDLEYASLKVPQLGGLGGPRSSGVVASASIQSGSAAAGGFLGPGSSDILNGNTSSSSMNSHQHNSYNSGTESERGFGLALPQAGGVLSSLGISTVVGSNGSAGNGVGHLPPSSSGSAAHRRTRDRENRASSRQMGSRARRSRHGSSSDNQPTALNNSEFFNATSKFSSYTGEGTTALPRIIGAIGATGGAAGVFSGVADRVRDRTNVLLASLAASSSSSSNSVGSDYAHRTQLQQLAHGGGTGAAASGTHGNVNTNTRGGGGAHGVVRINTGSRRQPYTHSHARGGAASGAGGMLTVTAESHEKSGVTSIKGLKPGNPNWTNQDNFIVLERMDGRDVSLFCVLDGHGGDGHHVSRRCRESLPAHIKQCSTMTAGISGSEMKCAFAMMQQELMQTRDFDTSCAGATCVMATLVNGKLSVSNCGDSRAVLGRRNPNGSISAHALSFDHKPDKPEERRRILSVGGHLGCRQVIMNQGGMGHPVSVPVGPCRVWYQHNGETLGLAMSRSLGDVVVHRSGVSAEPELVEHIVDCFDEFLILATDGVWDVVDNAQAVAMVANVIMKAGAAAWNPTEASQYVAMFARQRWEKLSPMVDDITCIVVKLNASST